MTTGGQKSTARIVAACAAIALMAAAGTALIFRNWSLTGFFLAISIGAAGMAAAVWPDENERP